MLHSLRIPAPTSRNLWLLTAGLVAIHQLWVIQTTQTTTAFVFSLLCWWGALTCMEDRLDSLRPNPSWPSLMAGSTILLWSLVRSAQILDRDSMIYMIAVLQMIGLAFLCKPIRKVAVFWQQILILCLVPLSLVGQRFFPEGFFSIVTARMATAWLTIFGFEATNVGKVVTINQQASVAVAGPCTGYEQISQVIAIAVIFLLAFPLRKRNHQIFILIVAPSVAIVCNAFRIALLNVIIYFEGIHGSKNQWWFDFFHEGEGSLIFSGVAVCLFAWLYLKVLDRELGPFDIPEPAETSPRIP
jgi:cyanoexosortase A